MSIGRCGDDPEAQARRRDRLEVAGVGEEREDLLGRRRQALLALEDVDPHPPGYGRRALARIGG